MAQTYAHLQEQISKLQAEADRLRQEEFTSVVAAMRESIAAYGVTPQDLFGKSGARARSGRSKSGGPAKYGDGSGNIWGGRGPRPRWLREALAGGRKLDDFLLGQAAPAAPAEPASAPKKAAAKKAKARK